MIELQLILITDKCFQHHKKDIKNGLLYLQNH